MDDKNPAPPVAPGGWLALTFLLLIYVSSFMDRTILSALGEPIKRELGLSDTQLGLLGGLAFALTYSILGVPFARLAERRSRKMIIVVVVAIWSAMTALCGFAQGFAQLLAFRAFVGLGEAGFTAPAHALISDYSPPPDAARRYRFSVSAFPSESFSAHSEGDGLLICLVGDGPLLRLVCRGSCLACWS